MGEEINDNYGNRSFVRGKRVQKFASASMEIFLKELKQGAPGFYIIGLDLHVGLLMTFSLK